MIEPPCVLTFFEATFSKSARMVHVVAEVGLRALFRAAPAREKG